MACLSCTPICFYCVIRFNVTIFQVEERSGATTEGFIGLFAQKWIKPDRFLNCVDIMEVYSRPTCVKSIYTCYIPFC